MWKAYHLSIEGIRKGYVSVQRAYKRVRGQTSGWGMEVTRAIPDPLVLTAWHSNQTSQMVHAVLFFFHYFPINVNCKWNLNFFSQFDIIVASGSERVGVKERGFKIWCKVGLNLCGVQPKLLWLTGSLDLYDCPYYLHPLMSNLCLFYL